MPTDVKLNAEGVEAAVMATGELHFLGNRHQKITRKAIRAYLAALDNSKPTPAVGDDGLIAELRRAYPVTITDASTLIARTASALAAAHSQHEADVAMIAELTERWTRLVSVAEAFVRLINPQLLPAGAEQQREALVHQLDQAALAGVKP